MGLDIYRKSLTCDQWGYTNIDILILRFDNGDHRCIDHQLLRRKAEYKITRTHQALLRIDIQNNAGKQTDFILKQRSYLSQNRGDDKFGAGLFSVDRMSEWNPALQ